MNQETELLGATGDRYIDSYLGAWCIEPSHGNALLTIGQSLSLEPHRAQHFVRLNSGMLAPEPIKLSSVEMDASVNAQSQGGPYSGQLTSDGVAIIRLNGSLMKFQSSMSSSTGTVEFRRAVRAASVDSRVKGIMLVVESPGGTVSGTADAADDVILAGSRKPLWTYAEDMIASAAYWIGSNGQRIGSNRTALVGSLGTVGVLYDWSAAAEKNGVKAYVFSTGEFKGAGTPGAEITEKQREYYQALINETNSHFVDAVSKSRGFDAKHLFDGRVHLAKDAKSLKLIDDVMSIDDFYNQFVSHLSKSNARTARAEDTSNITAEASPPETASMTQGISMPEGTENKKIAASLAEIEAACQGASNDFIVAQLKGNATLDEAKTAYFASILARNAALEAKVKTLEEAKAETKAETKTETKAEDEKAVEQKATAKTPGNSAVGNASDTTIVGVNAASQFMAIVAEKKKAGMDSFKALVAAAKEEPELHAAYIASK